jgi:hypothetical protein
MRRLWIEQAGVSMVLRRIAGTSGGGAQARRIYPRRLSASASETGIPFVRGCRRWPQEVVVGRDVGKCSAASKATGSKAPLSALGYVIVVTSYREIGLQRQRWRDTAAAQANMSQFRSSRELDESRYSPSGRPWLG